MNRVKRLVSVALVAVVATSGLSAVAIAATPASSANGGQGLEISPPVLELKADPGQTIVANIRLRNVTKGELAVTGKADDFGAKGENGEPQILLDEKESTRYSLKFWVQSVPDFRLVPQEVKTARVQIAVPANAEPGGHYGVIRFTGLPPELEGTGVSLNASIGALVLLKVSGNITEKLSLKDFYVSHYGKRGGFFENGPLQLTERIRNEGSVHEKPTGGVGVYDLSGKQIANLPLNPKGHNVLPDSIRKFDQSLEKSALFGRYTAKLSSGYGTNKTLVGAVSFWVIPWKLILSVLILLVLAYYIARYSLRRYNQKIIEQARKRR